MFVLLVSQLNTHTNRIFHCKTLKKWRFVMEYRVCVAVESTQYPHKSYIPLPNAKKWCFAMDYRVCVAVESTHYTHTNRIFHRKTLKKWCFAMGYRVCMAVESTQYPHKSYTLLKNAKKMLFYNGISCFCGC